MMFQKALFLSIFFLSQTAHSKPLALVYEGPGSCSVEDGDCTGAAAHVADMAGFEVKKVGPSALKAESSEKDYREIFSRASVWIQPGGTSQDFLKIITPQMKQGIHRFVKEGGGYVGFCAGAFASTKYDGTLKLEGLDVFPGETHAYPNEWVLEFYDNIYKFFFKDSVYNKILPITWLGKKRYVYWEEGPYLRNLPSSVEVVATYENDKVAAARTTFGLGRVFVTGLHPEAPQDWREHPTLDDKDGLDFDLAVDMIHWAAKKL